jgi:hypothetical protein
MLMDLTEDRFLLISPEMSGIMRRNALFEKKNFLEKEGFESKWAIKYRKCTTSLQI